MAKNYIATLVYGNVYILKDKKFPVGVPVEVTQEEKDILERDAVELDDRIKGGRHAGVITINKFEFTEVDDDKPKKRSRGTE